MKAVIMTAPAMDGSTTSVAGFDEPQPGPGQVAIDVAYAGVNFIDVMARRGDPGYASAWPYVPGLEVAGTIRSVGSGVRDLHVGERVAALTPGGGMAEVAIAAADVTVAVPPDVPLETAASAPLVVSTALLLLTDRARIRPGESVLMHSASGGIGSVVSQVAAALGSGRRIGTVGRPGKIAAALAAGWDEVFAREDGLAEAVRKVVPEGVDVILDPVGTALLDFDLSIAAPGGRVLLFGNAAGGAQPPLPSAGRLIGGNVGVLGFSMSRLSATAPKAVQRQVRHQGARLTRASSCDRSDRPAPWRWPGVSVCPACIAGATRLQAYSQIRSTGPSAAWHAVSKIRKRRNRTRQSARSGRPRRRAFHPHSRQGAFRSVHTWSQCG